MDTPTDAEIMQTLAMIDKGNSGSAYADNLFVRAASAIRWLQAGKAAAEAECETKADVIQTLTDGKGIDNEELWSLLETQRDAAIDLIEKLTRRQAIVPSQIQLAERFLRSVGKGVRVA